MIKDEAKIKAMQQGSQKMIEANLLLFEALDILDPHTNPGFNKEIGEIQERLRDATGAINRLQ